MINSIKLGLKLEILKGCAFPGACKEVTKLTSEKGLQPIVFLHLTLNLYVYPCVVPSIVYVVDMLMASGDVRSKNSPESPFPYYK